MDKIYLVVIDLFEEEENAIIDICSSYEKAVELYYKYREDSKDTFSYHIDEVELDPNKEVLWDCYKNNDYFRRK